MSFLEDLGYAFVPDGWRTGLHRYLHAAGIRKEPYSFFAILFFMAILATSLIYLFVVYPLIKDINQFLFFLYTFISFTGISFLFIVLIIMFIYFYLDITIYKRITAIEAKLPDYLQIVSTNVKSGISLEKSLWVAMSPRFGVLNTEMQIVLKKVMAGYDLEQALTEFSDLYRSQMLRRSVALLVGEIDSGGKISHIIDSIVRQLKDAQKMKAELAASVITYMIFIGAIVVVISPALFALSYNLLSFMDGFIQTVADSDAQGGPIQQLSSGNLDVEGFRTFSLIAVVLVSFLSSGIVSVIERGDIRGGLKYFPIFVIGAVVAYLIFMIILDSLFGGIIL